MKVVSKLALVFFVASCLCLAGFAYADARREVADLRASVAVDMRAFGEGLREGMLAGRAAHGDEGAASIIRAASGKRGDVEVTWTAGSDAFASAASAAERASVDDDVMSVAIPVDAGAGTVGAIVLRRQVLDEGDVSRAALAEELAFAAALAAVLGALVVVLGGAVIGRPLQRVVADAQRIGGGDLSHRFASRSRARGDEIGQLESALDVMCDRLAAARDQVEKESAARVETLEQLRHLDRLRTVGTLASSLAHELGTPLNVLLLRGQALAAGEIEAGELAPTGEIVTAQVEKMRKIVQQILAFARRAPSTTGVVRLGDVARRVADLLRALARKGKAELVVQVDDDAAVAGESVQLEQAVTNLVVNGLHAMPDGGAIRLRVGIAEGARRSAATTPVRAAFIEVTDEGAGIDRDQLARIFEPFYTSRPSGEGTGLGLPVSRGIAEDHGGWISATSEPNRGSTFTMFIPASQSGSASATVGP
jgi:signal transduction histidine kinase